MWLIDINILGELAFHQNKRTNVALYVNPKVWMQIIPAKHEEYLKYYRLEYRESIDIRI